MCHFKNPNFDNTTWSSDQNHSVDNNSGFDFIETRQSIATEKAYRLTSSNIHYILVCTKISILTIWIRKTQILIFLSYNALSHFKFFLTIISLLITSGWHVFIFIDFNLCFEVWSLENLLIFELSEFKLSLILVSCFHLKLLIVGKEVMTSVLSICSATCIILSS